MAGKMQAAYLMATIVIAAISGICSAATYTVGDNTGWTIPSSPNFYSNWASRQTFQVGDVLVFNFPAGQHTVAEVNKANFDACGTTNTIGSVHNTAPASITLTTAGTHYFICTVTGHCGANQKLSVVVTGPSATTPASAPAPTGRATPPAASPTTPAGRAPTPTPAASPTTPAGSAPTPSVSPITPAPSPTTPSGGAPSPATAPTTPTGGAPPPSPSTPTTPVPSSPTADVPSGSTPPAGNFATSTSVSLLSLVSVALAAFML